MLINILTLFKQTLTLILFIFILLVPKKIVARSVLSVLAQMNDKLNVIEKTVAKPVVAENENYSSDEEDFLATLPLTNIEQFEKFERDLEQDKAMFNKLVSYLPFLYLVTRHALILSILCL